MNLIERNIEKLKKLCIKYNVFQLYIFGSVLNEHFNNESDIDFLVSFGKLELEKYADNYFDFKFSLEDLFKRKIDLLEDKAIKNPFLRQSINTSKKLIYG
ncbi:MAG: nucleotidyltransferase domain-containing protein [Candidatus Cloacimonetes bacterium]|nr:nucleotidyltransferase domain-containing protein [Candidatus Cloacimonadota bacterium]